MNVTKWIWYMLMTLWIVLESYWASLGIEGKYPWHIVFPMVTLSAMIGLGFFYAFLKESKKEGGKDDDNPI